MEQAEQHPGGTVRLAAVGDVHCTKNSQGVLQPIFASVAQQADVLLLCGDLCDYGTVEEAHILVRELASVRVPIVAVLGNHDFESGQQDAVKEILCGGDIQMLDGDAVEIRAGEEPVFWACGVTPQVALMNAKPPFAITHKPGHMFLTDLTDADLEVE